MEPFVRLTADCSAKGLIVKSRVIEKSVSAFLGIPYAQPPVGSLRFQPPKALELWKGERSCVDYGHIACQNIQMVQRMMHPFKIPTDTNEDCLYLNVWTPNTSKESRLPVMVWIHGGAFQTGFSNHYDGTVLAALENVIVVSINYRLGAFGFMSTGDGVIKGNMGMHDQVEALRWVKKHISHFGGDPENITLFGESAGAISISFHMLSPMSRGLFKRVICQSGFSLYPSAVWPQKNMAKSLHKKLQNAGIKVADGKQILQHLLPLSSEEVQSICGDTFQPCVDGQFLPDHPANLYKQGYLTKGIDFVIGFNSDEGAMFIYELTGWKPVKTKQEAFKLLDILIDYGFFRHAKNAAEIKKILKEEYFTDKDSEQNWTHGLIQLYGDLLFVAPSIQGAELQAKSASGATYVYAFEERPTVSRYPNYIKADHAQEIMFVFGEMFMSRLPEYFNSMWSDDEKRTSKQIMRRWCNFARNGNPNDDTSDITWSEFTLEKEQYLSIQHQPEMKKSYNQRRIKLWNEVIPALLLNSKY